MGMPHPLHEREIERLFVDPAKRYPPGTNWSLARAGGWFSGRRIGHTSWHYAGESSDYRWNAPGPTLCTDMESSQSKGLGGL